MAVYALKLPAGLPPWVYGLIIILMIATVVSTAAVRIVRTLSPQESKDRLSAFTRWLAYRRWARSRGRRGSPVTHASPGKPLHSRDAPSSARGRRHHTTQPDVHRTSYRRCR
jgi:hypothetical protein